MLTVADVPDGACVSAPGGAPADSGAPDVAGAHAVDSIPLVYHLLVFLLLLECLLASLLKS